MEKKRLTAFLLIITSVLYAYSPLMSKGAEAQVGASANFTVADAPRIIERTVDGIALSIAQTMIDGMVRSTINWANSGFNGNPAYVTDPQQYFKDTADQAAGNYIFNDPNIGFICSPFRAQVQLALINQYTNAQPNMCTFTGALSNLEGFYNDFSQGGWDAWFQMTQNDANNPYGAYISNKIALDAQIANKTKFTQKELDWGKGFLSKKECTKWQIHSNDPSVLDSYSYSFDQNKMNFSIDANTKATCVSTKTVTPGDTIAAQINNVLPSGLNKLINANTINQLISSFANGLLTRYVFGNQGLFARGTGTSATNSEVSVRNSILDLDGDGLPDGEDLDQDGKLATPNVDVCYHGGAAPDCKLSSQVTNSPYFTPLCQATGRALATLEDYKGFVDDHASDIKDNGVDFKDLSDTRIWGLRSQDVSTAVEDVLSTIQSYHAPMLEPYEFATNRFAYFIDIVVSSLMGDGFDLDLHKGSGTGPKGTNFAGGYDGVKEYITLNTAYFDQLKSKLGDCSDPAFTTLGDVTPPPSFFADCTDGSCPAIDVLVQEATGNTSSQETPNTSAQTQTQTASQPSTTQPAVAVVPTSIASAEDLSSLGNMVNTSGSDTGNRAGGISSTVGSSNSSSDSSGSAGESGSFSSGSGTSFPISNTGINDPCPDCNALQRAAQKASSNWLAYLIALIILILLIAFFWTRAKRKRESEYNQ